MKVPRKRYKDNSEVPCKAPWDSHGRTSQMEVPCKSPVGLPRVPRESRGVSVVLPICFLSWKFPMVLPWNFREVFMDLPLDFGRTFYSSSMELPWCFREASTRFGDFHGIPVELRNRLLIYLVCSHGTPVGFSTACHGTST